MTLRIMLLGLVASMGLELPSGPDLSRWTQSGRDWVSARMADLTGSEVAADRLDSEPTGCLQADAASTPSPVFVAAPEVKPDADAAFVAASEGMAKGFAADLIAIRDEQPSIEATPASIAEAQPSVGLPDGEESATQVAVVVAPEPAEVVVADIQPDDVTVEVEESSTRAERVNSALRLTRQAVQAWSDVLQESAEVDCPCR